MNEFAYLEYPLLFILPPHYLKHSFRYITLDFCLPLSSSSPLLKQMFACRTQGFCLLYHNFQWRKSADFFYSWYTVHVHVCTQLFVWVSSTANFKWPGLPYCASLQSSSKQNSELLYKFYIMFDDGLKLFSLEEKKKKEGNGDSTRWMYVSTL